MIPEKYKVLEVLGKPTGKSELITWNQSTSNIISELMKNHNRIYPDAVKIAPMFQGYSVLDTCHNIFSFLKKNVSNVREDAENQTSKTIPKLLMDGFGDCKHYSNTSAAIASALGIPVEYRFADYGYKDDQGNPIGLQHVYTVAKDNGREIIIDGVLNEFNREKPYYKKLDRKMALRHLSGTEEDIIGASKIKEAIKSKVQTVVKKVEAKLPPKVQTAVKKVENKIKSDVKKVEQKIHAIPDAIKNQKVKAIVTKTKTAIKKVEDKAHQRQEDRKERREDRKEDRQANVRQVKEKIKTKVDKIKKTAQNALDVHTGLKKIGLAEPRGAFLILVGFNAKGLATKLKNTNQVELKKTWESLGGDYDKLMKVVNKGATKKYLGNINDPALIGAVKDYLCTIGDPATITAIASTILIALPVLVVIIKMLKKNATPEELKDLDDLANAASGAKTKFENQTGVDLDNAEYYTESEGNDSPDQFNIPDTNQKGVPNNKPGDKPGDKDDTGINPLLIGAGLLVAYQLFK